VYECKVEDDGKSKRKEKSYCGLKKFADKMKTDEFSVPYAMGADYCYFSLPWPNLAYAKYECMEKEGLKWQYFSSYCIESYNYNQS
jgi:hypothetical protein